MEDRKLQVLLDDSPVGELAMTADAKVAFAYDKTWLEEGFSISPFSLPLEERVFVPGRNHFDGLFGVFADSLPDAWGNLLVERMLEQRGMPADVVTPIDRLFIVGQAGAGALTYQPARKKERVGGNWDLDELAEDCMRLLNHEREKEVSLDDLFELGGSSGGARPKVTMDIDGMPWLIKFPSHLDPKEIGSMEFEYSQCARRCGITMTETRLFESSRCRGYFGTARFDRGKNGKRIHMVTAAGLLELDYRQPSMDYHDLMKLTKILTQEDGEQVEQMYRRACFNVFAHNRDDHAKNFSFLYDEDQKRWKLAPAYDLTYSNTYFGEHTTSVDGNGKDPGISELVAVGMTAGISKKRCQTIAEEIKEQTASLIEMW